MLVDVGRVNDLAYIRDEGDHVAIGALTRHRDLETSDLLTRECGVLRAVAAQVGDNQVRHRGTIGGSAAHGDPASDLPAALLALDATFVARSSRGARDIAAADFFKGFLETALEPDELLTEIRVPKSGSGGFSYQKFNRRAQDWAIVGALAVHSTEQTQGWSTWPTPLRARGRRRSPRARHSSMLRRAPPKAPSHPVTSMRTPPGGAPAARAHATRSKVQPRCAEIGNRQVGSAFLITLNTAPCGSASADMRPTPGTSIGSASTDAPSSFALATVASQSATAK